MAALLQLTWTSYRVNVFTQCNNVKGSLGDARPTSALQHNFGWSLPLILISFYLRYLYGLQRNRNGTNLNKQCSFRINEQQWSLKCPFNILILLSLQLLLMYADVLLGGSVDIMPCCQPLSGKGEHYYKVYVKGKAQKTTTNALKTRKHRLTFLPIWRILIKKGLQSIYMLH